MWGLNNHFINVENSIVGVHFSYVVNLTGSVYLDKLYLLHENLILDTCNMLTRINIWTDCFIETE